MCAYVSKTKYSREQDVEESLWIIILRVFFFWIVAYIAHIGTKGAVHEGDVLVGKGAKLDSLSLTHSPTIYIKFNYPFDELIHK